MHKTSALPAGVFVISAKNTQNIKKRDNLSKNDILLFLLCKVYFFHPIFIKSEVTDMKKYISILLAAALILTLCACGGSKAKSEPLTFTTGGEAGTYYAFGSVLAQFVSGKTDLSITAVSSGGSQANIEDIAAGNAQLGFSQSDVLSYAYSGSRSFADSGAITGMSTVAALYMEQVQIVTTNPEIKSVADLRGKNVSIGAAGSGTYFNAIDILGVYGMTEEDINPVYQSFADSAESLKDKKIDAAFIVAGAPTTAVTDLSTAGDVFLVSIDDDKADELIALSPYYSKCTITADTYGMPDDAITVAIAAVVLAKDDVSSDAVYNFVSTVFENIPAISEQHGKGAELSLEFASSITDVPYHPGAAKYFSEKGITVASK